MTMMKQQQQQQQRNVHFGEVSERIIPEQHLTKAEREVLWFTKAQLRTFRQFTELSAATPTTTPQQEHAYYSACGTMRPTSYLKRSRYVSLVLHFQDSNRKSGMDDPTGFGALACAQSKSALESALIRAERDATEVLLEAYEEEASRSEDEEVSYINNSNNNNEAPVQEEEVEEYQATTTSCHRRRSPCSRIQRPQRNRTVANMA